MDYSLLLAVLAGIALLLFLILYFKIQAFLSLLISSITVGLLAGMSPIGILKSIQDGMGGTLGFIAIVVGLGAIFGAILEHSGGVQALASVILKAAGEKNASWALMATGFMVAIPVFLMLVLSYWYRSYMRSRKKPENRSSCMAYLYWRDLPLPTVLFRLPQGLLQWRIFWELI